MRAEDVAAAMVAAGGGPTFEDIAKEFIVRHVEAKRLRSKPEIERHIRVYVAPRWAELPFASIKRRDVNDLLDHWRIVMDGRWQTPCWRRSGR